MKNINTSESPRQELRELINRKNETNTDATDIYKRMKIEIELDLSNAVDGLEYSDLYDMLCDGCYESYNYDEDIEIFESLEDAVDDLCMDAKDAVRAVFFGDVDDYYAPVYLDVYGNFKQSEWADSEEYFKYVLKEDVNDTLYRIAADDDYDEFAYTIQKLIELEHSDTAAEICQALKKAIQKTIQAYNNGCENKQ